MNCFCRALVMLLTALALIFVSTASVFALPYKTVIFDTDSLSAKAAVLLEADSGCVLLSKNSNTRMGPASTTKIMTAMVVFENARLDETVMVSPKAVGVEGSSVYLKSGERLTVSELLHALLLSSANDAAVALAVHCFGSVEAFVARMNAKAHELGLRDTHFTNPHGLYDDEHYTTAYELAMIAKEALRYKELEKIFSSRTAVIGSSESENLRRLYNHNKLLSTYDGAVGMKTGFTKLCGRTLVSAARRDSLTLIAVTLSAPDDWRDHTRMLDHGFENYENALLYDSGEYCCAYDVSGGTETHVLLTNPSPIRIFRRKGDSEASLRIEAYHRFEFAPIEAGTALAMLTIDIGDASADCVLVAASSVPQYKKHK